jgi:branched-chain amino acid transport system substrate-binding protein
MYQVCFTDPNQGTGAADYIAENISGTVAVIYQNDDAYSQGIRDTFVAEAAEKGLDVVYEGTFTADTATDFSVQLTAAQAAGAEIIFLPMYYTPASVILKQADSMGYAPTFFGVDGMDGILTMEGFDTSLAEGVMLLTPFSADATDDLTQNFVSKYQELYGETPNQFAADGYDAVYIIYEALQAAGCTADMSAADICEALVAVMPTITVDGLTGEGMTWSSTGEVSKSPRAVVIKDGVYVTP